MRSTIAVVLAMGIAAAAPCAAQTNVRAWNAAGQTWVVWEASAPLPTVYSIYRAASPVADATNATLAGRVCPGECFGERLKIGDGSRTWVAPTTDADPTLT